MSHSWVIQNEFEASSQQTVSLGSLVRPQLSIASSWPLHLMCGASWAHPRTDRGSGALIQSPDAVNAGSHARHRAALLTRHKIEQAGVAESVP